jgi:hypothetical protein
MAPLLTAPKSRRRHHLAGAHDLDLDLVVGHQRHPLGPFHRALADRRHGEAEDALQVIGLGLRQRAAGQRGGHQRRGGGQSLEGRLHRGVSSGVVVVKVKAPVSRRESRRPPAA